MKQLLTLLLLLSLILTAAAAVPTGSDAPEITVKEWIKGPARSLKELKDKKTVVLFFWTLSKKGIDAMPEVAKTANSLGEKEVQFIAVGCDSPESLKTLKDLDKLPFPVAADDKLDSVNNYMRQTDKVPMIAIVNKEGKLAWRGSVENFEPVLKEVMAGKYDVAAAVDRENFAAEIMDEMKSKNYANVIKLIDGELAKKPGNDELLMFKVNLFSTVLKSPLKAIEVLDQVIAKRPDDTQLYEMGVKILKDNKKEAELSKYYDRIIKTFANDPKFLIKLAQQEMSQSLAQVNIRNSYKLADAAVSAPKFTDVREKGVVISEAARIMYYAGRPDKAAQMTDQAMTLLKNNPKEYEAAKMYNTYYKSVVELSKEIK